MCSVRYLHKRHRSSSIRLFSLHLSFSLIPCLYCSWFSVPSCILIFICHFLSVLASTSCSSPVFCTAGPARWLKTNWWTFWKHRLITLYTWKSPTPSHVSWSVKDSVGLLFSQARWVCFPCRALEILALISTSRIASFGAALKLLWFLLGLKPQISHSLRHSRPSSVHPGDVLVTFWDTGTHMFSRPSSCLTSSVVKIQNKGSSPLQKASCVKGCFLSFIIHWSFGSVAL